MEKDAEFLKRLLAMFRNEAQEHLKIIASGLIDIEKTDGAEQAEIVEAVFRESHSLKGAARSVNMPDVVEICQSMEGVFSVMKRGQIRAAAETLDLLHRAAEYLGRLVTGEKLSPSDKTAVKELRRKLDNVASGLVTAARPPGSPAKTDTAVREAAPPEEIAGTADAKGAQEDAHAAPVHAIHVSETVRISVSRLDTLLLQAEEMLSIKLAAAQRAAEFREIKKEMGLLKKELGKGGIGEKPGGLLPSAAATPFVASLESRLAALQKNAEYDSRACGQMIDRLLEDIKKTLMLPCSALLGLFPPLARNLSLEAGKKTRLAVTGEEIEIDRRILEEIKAPLIHLVRNSVDHGIEPPGERERAGKPACGDIRISVASRNGKIEIEVSDDGAGLDTQKVKAVAVKLGLITREKAERLGADETLSLVFRSGFTTSPIITDISGRGLGLAIVREKIEKLNGFVTLETVPGAGTTIRMTMPLTLATFRGLLVREAGQLFILPSMNVGGAIRIRREDMRTVEKRDLICFEGQALSLVRLADALGIGGGDEKGSGYPTVLRRAGTGPYLQVVVIGTADMSMAFLVDEVLQEQEVLMKPLGGQLSRIRNILGATVLGNGKVVPILNPYDLVKSAVKCSRHACAAAADPRIGGHKGGASVLVVEDSITSRTLLKNVLDAAGFDVKTAIDGIDALNSLVADRFDLVVSDVDMPRMNGFDLTARIRADKEISELPVVLVTALDSPEDKERGIDAGANAYIVKSGFDQDNLLEVIRRLL
jgi:two-component system chemotaxis sensor kinase CheA